MAELDFNDHDRNFKQLLTTFFVDFVDLFFPTIAAGLDRDSIEFLPQEVFVNQFEGGVYRTDILVKARFHGVERHFLIHVEHQSAAEGEFPERFFIYNTALFEKYRVPVYPIVVFSHDRPLKQQPDVFRIEFADGPVHEFRYRVVQLNRLPWRDFVAKKNPVASALMAKMKIAEEDRPRVKLECLRLMLTLKLDAARMRLIGSFVDSYLRLNAQESREFQGLVESAELAPEERRQVVEYVTSWTEEGIQIGRALGLEQGRAQGREEGLRGSILKVLRARFGELDPHLIQRLEAVHDPDELEALAVRAALDPDLSTFLRGA